MEEKTHGGARKGAGAKKKADVEKANEVFLSMIKSVHSVETDEEAKQALAKTLYSFERGQMFIAEHIFGKPKETIENINIDAGKLTPDEVKIINQNLDKSY
jgi:predicted DNA binding CopG/RHH family protein